MDPGFWRGRRVLLTGHTGFKGAWCALWLWRMGAVVTGYALEPDTVPSLFEGARVGDAVRSHVGDLCDGPALARCIEGADPEIVLHLAARSLVRQAYAEPLEVVRTNVLGTAQLLDALRHAPSLRAVLVVTTDKVYRNEGSGAPFLEDDTLGGSEPYGASKAAAEIVVGAMAASYFAPRGIPVATARGGNVIGGGDYAPDRVVPDVIRSVRCGEPVRLRHPSATRPWQHVLDCLAGYLAYLQALAAGERLPMALNFGPDLGSGVPVRQLVEALLDALGAGSGWVSDGESHPPEAPALALNSSLAREVLGWTDRLPGAASVATTARWYQEVGAGTSMRAATEAQIAGYADAGEPATARPA